MNNTTTRNWSNLSANALVTIDLMFNLMKPLELPDVTVRLVCKKWRNSVVPPLVMLHPFLPLLLSNKPQQNYSFDLKQNPHFRLVPTSVFLLRRKSEHPSPWWLVSVEKIIDEECLRLFHPLTRSRIPMELFTDIINPNLEFIELSNGCNLRFYTGLLPAFGHLPQDFCVSKVILWREPIDDQMFPTYTVVILRGHGKLHCCRVTFSFPQELVGICHVESMTTLSCRNASNMDKGTTTTSDSLLKFDDVVIWKGTWLFAVDCQGALYNINYYPFKAETVGGRGLIVNESCGSKRLLVTLDNLYLIVCNGNSSQSSYLFMVYHADETYNWVPQWTLGSNIIFFVGYDTCFLGTTDLFTGFQGDSIVYPKRLYPVFTDDEIRDGVKFHGQLDYLDICVCSYRQSRIEAVQQVVGSPNLSSVFWPPPASIFQNYVEGVSNNESTTDV